MNPKPAYQGRSEGGVPSECEHNAVCREVRRSATSTYIATHGHTHIVSYLERCALDDMRKHTRTMSVRSCGEAFAPAAGVEGIGEVGRCGHWDAEYDQYGYCRDRECRHERLVRALQSGDAWRMPDGTLMWFVK